MNPTRNDNEMLEYTIHGTNNSTVWITVDYTADGPSYSIDTEGIGKLSEAQMRDAIAAMTAVLMAGRRYADATAREAAA